MTTDSLLQTLNRAAVLEDAAVSTPSLADAVADLAVALRRAEPVTRPRRRRRPVRVAALLAAVLLVPATVGLAYQAGSRTGWFGNPAFSEEDGSEWLRTDAPDFAAVVTSLRPALPLPVGASWTAEIDYEVTEDRREPGLIQETGVRRNFESYARCAWFASWLAATERGEPRGAAQAAKVVARSAVWPVTAATDGGGVVDHLRAIAAAARRGDVAPVRAEFRTNCDGFDLRGIR